MWYFQRNCFIFNVKILKKVRLSENLLILLEIQFTPPSYRMKLRVNLLIYISKAWNWSIFREVQLVPRNEFSPANTVRSPNGQSLVTVLYVRNRTHSFKLLCSKEPLVAFGGPLEVTLKDGIPPNDKMAFFKFLLTFQCCFQNSGKSSCGIL